MWLSILLPSSRPDDLAKFLQSLKDNTYLWYGIELILRLHDDKEYDEALNILSGTVDNFEFEYKSSKASIGDIGYELYKHATGSWIFSPNDDMLCETKHWDLMLSSILSHSEDTILYWPNDMVFKEAFACFPIVSKRVIDTIGYYPTPNYMKYKVDDEIWNAFPPERRIYLEQIVFRHLNDKGIKGLNDPVAMEHDEKLYKEMVGRQAKMKQKLMEMIR